MTTESQHPRRGAMAPGGARVLLGSAAAAAAAGLGLALLGAVVDGTDAGLGALLGAALVVSVLGLGAATVGLVAGLAPSASLLVALLTYALQVLVIGLALLVLDRSGLLGGALARGWLAGGVVAGTLVWSLAQVLLAARVRVPVYDLSERAATGRRPEGPEASAR